MEFLICLWIASMLTGIRPISDAIHALKGQEPPHLAKARLRAATEQQRLAAKQAKAENRGVRPGEDKPTLGDVMRVYWGNAMTDAIDMEETRRAEKRERRARAEAGQQPTDGQEKPGKLKQLGSLIWNGTPAKDQEAVNPVAAVNAALATDSEADGPIITCADCGAGLEENNGDWRHPAGSTCPKATKPAPAASAKPATPQAPPIRRGTAVPNGMAAERERRTQAAAAGLPETECLRCKKPAALVTRTCCATCATTCPRCGQTVDLVPGEGMCGSCLIAARPRPRPVIQPVSAQDGAVDWNCRHCGEQSRRLYPSLEQADDAYYREHPVCPVAGKVTRTNAGKVFFRCGLCRFDSGPIYDDHAAASAAHASHKCPEPTEGEDMNETAATAPTATGDAHDVESARHECGLLGDDLTRIDTALDVIDEAVTAAGAAAERIEAFLASKNVDDCAVGGMASARDMLSAERIKALIDAIAAAKQGVANADEELVRLQELEQQLAGADGSILNGR